MIYLRSLIFNIAFYVNLIARLVIIMPAMMRRDKTSILSQAKSWAKSSTKMLEVIVGVTVDIEGTDNIPKGGYIFAAQHQSFWDTFAFIHLLESPVFIFKQEILKIPVFGRCMMILDMLPVDRKAKGTAMAGVLIGAKREIKDKGRHLFIFPEGTRRPVGPPIEYKMGVGRIYEEIGVPIVPVSLVSGLFWGRNSFLKRKGHFKARILPPIMPGLSTTDVMDKLVSDTQKAYDGLLLDAERQNPELFMPQDVQKRLTEIKNALA